MKHFLFLFLIVLVKILSSQDLVINEFSAKNNTIFYDTDFFQFSDWIELHNTSANQIDISDYFLSDDTLKKTKWTFPQNTIIDANSFLIIWADKKDTTLNDIHTNFKLSSDSGIIAIYTSDTNIYDIISYQKQYADISFGKYNNNWYYYSTPSPNKENIGDKFSAQDRSSEPIFSQQSGFFGSSINISLSSLPFDSIFYTTDGSTPNKNSSFYTNSISINQNTVLKAINYSNNKIPSKVISKSYFIDVNKTLPIASLIINPAFLWSDSIGIFNDNNIADRVEWKRYATVEYFENEQLIFDKTSDIKLFGSTAYELPQKSFAVYLNDDLSNQLFKNKDLDKFDSFIFRSSSDDWNITMMKDGFVQSLIQQQIDIDYQAYQPTVMYINGEYFGIFNLREKYNEDYLKNNHLVNKDSLDLIKLNYWGSPSTEIVSGTDTRYFEMLDYINNNDLTSDINFTGLSQYLDKENYTDYIITEIYTGNRSYKHNIRTWRENNYNDNFKWLIQDLDRAYQDSYREMFQMIYDADPVLNNMLKNLNYRNHFLQKLYAHINVSFDYNVVNNLLDSLKSNIEAEMPLHIAKWGSTGGVPSMSVWEQNLQKISDFSIQREDTLTRRLIDFYSLDGRINVNFAKIKGGKVEIENLEIKYLQKYMDFFKNVPVKFVATPNFGYNFIAWENISTQDTIVFNFNTDTNITALFEADCDIPAHITQDAIFLLDCSPYHIDYNILVDSGATLYCEPGVEIFFDDSVMITVKGSLDFKGTSLKPITIKGEDGIYWKYINIDYGNLNLEYTNIYSGTKAIKTNGGTINIKYCSFYESDKNESDLIEVSGSKIDFHYNSIYGEINNTKTDALDCSYLIYGNFTYNTFNNNSDDCIDIGGYSTNVIIEYNTMKNSKSVGVSIGNNSSAKIFRNIISNCEVGIQSHTNSTANITNNTLYKNKEGIRLYRYTWTANTEGTAYVENTIFSNCVDSDYTSKPNSQIFIKYSLSDKLILPGQSNIMDNPLFIDTINFELQSESPCINKGNPLSPPDIDGTIIDIGAKFFNTNPTVEYLTTDDNNINLYPNPFKTSFIIESEKILKSIIIYSITGEKVFEQNNINLNYLTINIENKGLLLVKIIDDNNTVTLKKIIKE